MKKHIPNIITLLNLFSGCIAITMAFQGNFGAVVFWVALAAVFDFLDGMAARVLRAHSTLGKELDSLADVVSFGVAPGMAMFLLLRDFCYVIVYSYSFGGAATIIAVISLFIPYLAFLIPVFSAYRLAKFNVDERQTDSFIGLPTPANGLFWVSYCLGILPFISNYFVFGITILLIFALSILMISEIPMFSLKIKKLTFRGNERQIILTILIIAFIALWGIIGIAAGILAYILLSIITRVKK
ncbi:MAG: CDP-alcohol phosphatidyltransferase family protein [Dysgonamonadaceae bacterium]|jgi:CDP-diacylglycerol--serine O-phosphatidyltransferase|nr:CDP-alcohol phosphatidyltransferase family protein [Dysgonamonadaceae bacterium]